jgi:hypothetical protein
MFFVTAALTPIPWSGLYRAWPVVVIVILLLHFSKLSCYMCLNMWENITPCSGMDVLNFRPKEPWKLMPLNPQTHTRHSRQIVINGTTILTVCLKTAVLSFLQICFLTAVCKRKCDFICIWWCFYKVSIKVCFITVLLMLLYATEPEVWDGSGQNKTQSFTDILWRTAFTISQTSLESRYSQWVSHIFSVRQIALPYSSFIKLCQDKGFGILVCLNFGFIDEHYMNYKIPPPPQL